jgi:hypothetical protein
MLRDQLDRLKPQWAPLDVMDDLIIEEIEKPAESGFERARKELEMYFPLAVRSIGQIALHSAEERTRLSAAKYIIAANLRFKQMEKEGLDDPFTKMMRKFEEEARNIG